MLSATLRTASIIATLLSLLGPVPTACAQYPDSVDIDLRRSTIDTNNIEVYLRANGLGFTDVLSGLTFTIRWAATSPATLGAWENTCPEGIAVAPTAQVTNPLVDGVPTGFKYRTYNAFGISLLSDWGCALPADEWYLVTTIPVVGNDGCTVFNIVNDSFTDSPGNARDFFVSLGGFDYTGAIEPEPASIGTCSEPDCAGVPGGTALPGTPCDDGDPETENDLYDDQCACVGLPMGLDASGPEGFRMDLLPNPSSNGQVLLRMEGFAAAGMADIHVLDARGQRVVSTRAVINAGTILHGLDLGASIAAGPYLVLVTIGDQRYNRRLIIR